MPPAPDVAPGSLPPASNPHGGSVSAPLAGKVPVAGRGEGLRSSDPLSKGTDSILTSLRIRTAPAHVALEHDLKIEEVVQDPARYRRLLECLWGFYAPIEQRMEALDGWGELGIDLSRRRKAPWLEHDLHRLGKPGDPATWPRCPDLPELYSLARGLGAAYVLEGATLGGRQISGFLEGGAIPPDARTFFASYGDEVGARWREFCEVLERFGVVHAETETIVGAATETFETLHRWLRAGGLA